MEKRNETTGRRVIRIAITGPESTGKSELTWKLAKHYGGKYVRETARNYLEELGRKYNYFDLWVIAQMQLKNEQQRERFASNYLFCDTELTVIKIWSEHRFSKCHPWVLKKLGEIKYDLYLLCDVDLPWKPDPLREHSHLRKYFFDKYHNELTGRGLPFVIISGTGPQRVQNAVDAIDRFF